MAEDREKNRNDGVTRAEAKRAHWNFIKTLLSETREIMETEKADFQSAARQVLNKRAMMHQNHYLKDMKVLFDRREQETEEGVAVR